MMCVVVVTVGLVSSLVRRRSRGLLVGLFVAMLIPAAALASSDGVDVGSLAQALQRDPVQVVGVPSLSLSAADVRALRGNIAKVDPGRIWVAVVPSMGEKPTGDLSNALSGHLNADGGGTVIVVAGPSVWASTSWEDAAAATARLEAAFKNPHDPLAVQLRRVADSFASGDAAAGHPQLNAPSGGGTAATATRPSGGAHRGGGTGAGLLIGLIAVAVVLLSAAFVGGRRVRRTMRVSHRRKEERADAHEQAQADLGKLGEEIEALDIDSSMPNASARGKDEYATAIECYQDAERRLRKSGDEYQFERAVDALRRGREHVHAADRLFNAADEHSAALSTPDIASDAHPTDPAHQETLEQPEPFARRIEVQLQGTGSAFVATSESRTPLARVPRGQGRDVVDELAKLAALHDRGALTDSEFEEQKRKLLET